MIPQRIKLSGFLSYKDEQDIPFAGSAVWMLAGMNGSFYASIDRIPLGTAVTIEFLGPLVLAATQSRRLRDLGWVLLAGIVTVSPRARARAPAMARRFNYLTYPTRPSLHRVRWLNTIFSNGA